jgi:hypothetical protein
MLRRVGGSGSEMLPRPTWSTNQLRLWLEPHVGQCVEKLEAVVCGQWQGVGRHWQRRQWRAARQHLAQVLRQLAQKQVASLDHHLGTRTHTNTSQEEEKIK